MTELPRRTRHPLRLYAHVADQHRTTCEDCQRTWVRVFASCWMHICPAMGDQWLFCRQLRPNQFWLADSLGALAELAAKAQPHLSLVPAPAAATTSAAA